MPWPILIWLPATGYWLLSFRTKRTDVGAGGKGLAAFPAEFRLLGFAGLEARLDLLHFFRGTSGGADRGRTPRALDGCRRRRARGQDRFEQIGCALIPRRDVGG